MLNNYGLRKTKYIQYVMAPQVDLIFVKRKKRFK